MQGKRTDIQVLRAFSVLIVLVFHTRSSLLPNGYLGVDIFFLISGFILCPQIESLLKSSVPELRISLKLFFQKRINRLIPAFLVSTLLTLILLFLFSSLNQHRTIALQAISSTLFFGNLGAENLSGNYFAPQPNPYIHYWSLSAEWQVYLITPLLLLLGNRFLKIKTSSLVTLLLILGLTLKLIPGENSIIGYYSPFSRLWEFTFGMLLYQLEQKLKMRPYRKRFLSFHSFLFFVSFIAIASPIKLDIEVGQFFAGLFFLSFLKIKISLTEKLTAVLVWIGDRSYSIYLYHMPLIYLALYSPQSPSNFTYRALTTLLAVLLTFALANLSYLKVELVKLNAQPRIRVEVKNSRTAKLLLSTLVLSLSIFVTSSSQLYGPQGGSLVSVGWNLYPECRSSKEICLLSSGFTQDKILLIGDSHAMHLFGLMKPLSSATGSSVYYLNGKIEDYFLTRDFRKVIENLNPQLILISQYNKDSSKLGLFTQALRYLRSTQIDVIFVADNPVFSDYNAYVHYVNPSIASRFIQRKPPMRVEISSLKNGSKRLAKDFLAVAEGENFVTLDPFDFFCDQKFCYRNLDDDYIYFDDHHLSLNGAIVLYESLLERVQRLVTISPQIIKENGN